MLTTIIRSAVNLVVGYYALTGFLGSTQKTNKLSAIKLARIELDDAETELEQAVEFRIDLFALYNVEVSNGPEFENVNDEKVRKILKTTFTKYLAAESRSLIALRNLKKCIDDAK